MLFERIFHEFAAVHLNYIIIGGIAVNLHGYNRVTGDLDIIISLKDVDIQKFISVVKKLGLVPRIPVALEDFANSKKRDEWIHEKNMMVFSVYSPKDPMEHIDVKIDGYEEFDDLLKNAVNMELGDVIIKVIHINDLIRLKEKAGRERDLIDVKALKEIKKYRED